MDRWPNPNMRHHSTRAFSVTQSVLCKTQGMQFRYEAHHRTQVPLLRSDEELIETLEDNQVQLQNLMTSKHIAHFLDEVSAWQGKLSVADSVIAIWFEVQRAWTHLESIFIGSEDIRSQMPEVTAPSQSIAFESTRERGAPRRPAGSNLTSAASSRVTAVNLKQALIGLYLQFRNLRRGDFLIAPKVSGLSFNPDVCC